MQVCIYIYTYKNRHTDREAARARTDVTSRIFTPVRDMVLKLFFICSAAACTVRLTPVSDTAYRLAGIIQMGSLDAIEFVRYGEESDDHTKKSQLSPKQSISSPGSHRGCPLITRYHILWLPSQYIFVSFTWWKQAAGQSYAKEAKIQ